MKKRFIHITSILALFCGTAMAQDTPTPVTTESASSTSSSSVLKSKRGALILPEAGDWALGISASQSLRYVGNLFSGDQNTNNADGSFDYANNPTNNGNIWNTSMPTLYLKKFIDEKTAYRVRLSLNVSRSISTYDVLKNEIAPDVNYPSYVKDQSAYNQAGGLLAVGKEMRRGSHRIQGVYGAEAVIAFLASGQNYSYGNDLNSDFPSPNGNSTNFGNLGNPNGSGQRVISASYGNQFFVGARLFIGAEYFFAPKLSIGGEFGYTLGYSTQGNGTVTTERYDAATNTVVNVNKDTNSGGQRFVGISPDNLGGNINLLMYF